MICPNVCPGLISEPIAGSTPLPGRGPNAARAGRHNYCFSLRELILFIGASLQSHGGPIHYRAHGAREIGSDRPALGRTLFDNRQDQQLVRVMGACILEAPHSRAPILRDTMCCASFIFEMKKKASKQREIIMHLSFKPRDGPQGRFRCLQLQ